MDQNFPADRDAGVPDAFIQADLVDDEFQNIKGGLENCLTRDGQTTPSANTPWNSFKITNLGTASANGDAMSRSASDARYFQITNNLSEATAATVRTNIGLGDLSVINGPLPIASGGTGASSASAARTALAVPNIAGDTFTGDVVLADVNQGSQYSAGFRGSPIVTANADTTFALSYSGKCIYHTSVNTHTWTIPANASIAYPAGTVILLSNENAGGVITLAITSDTLRWQASTGSRSLAANSFCSITKVASTIWRLAGDGIS